MFDENVERVKIYHYETAPGVNVDAIRSGVVPTRVFKQPVIFRDIEIISDCDLQIGVKADFPNVQVENVRVVAPDITLYAVQTGDQDGSSVRNVDCGGKGELSLGDLHPVDVVDVSCYRMRQGTEGVTGGVHRLSARRLRGVLRECTAEIRKSRVFPGISITSVTGAAQTMFSYALPNTELMQSGDAITFRCAVRGQGATATKTLVFNLVIDSTTDAICSIDLRARTHGVVYYRWKNDMPY